MGITGLLPMLKKASAHCNVRKFSGCTVAIDGYSWLHKGAFGCAAQLGKGEPTTAYITYCVKYLNVLLSHNIKPIVVLDGRNLPSKAVTEKKRRAKREENRKKAKEFLRKGMNKEAWECFTRCVDVTPAMAREFIKVLRGMKIDYVIAPYEADAQLAYLAIHNIVDIIITEDSDLVLFGCPKIFFKMSISGDGVLFDHSKIPHSLGIKPEKFSFERFRWMCILSGCDYLPSLPGIGLGRAKKLMDGTTSQDIQKVLKALPKVLKLDVDVTEEYIEGFLQAEKTFLYQLVFDTIKKQLLPLTNYAADVDQSSLDFAGAYVDDKLALDLALGNVDLHTLKKVDNFDPNHSKSGYGTTSIWSPHFSIPTERKVVTARDMKAKLKPSSTVGMQANVSIGSIIKKRRHVETKNENGRTEEDDEQLVTMYSNTSLNDEPDDGNMACAQLELTCGSRRMSKRKRSFTSQSQHSSSDDVSDQNEEEEIQRPPTRRRNPFLKRSRSKSPLSDDIIKPTNLRENLNHFKTPVCLIERNRIYEESNMVVKSQYFRHLETSEDGKPTFSYSSETANFQIKMGVDSSSEEEDEVDDVPLTGIISEATDAQDSQLTIYSMENDSTNENESPSERTVINSQNSSFSEEENNTPVITLEDDDDDDEDSQISTRSRSSYFTKSSPSPKRVLSNSSPRKSPRIRMFGTGSCKPAGLSKSALKSKKAKVDPKQKTIASMFGLKPRPKM